MRDFKYTTNEVLEWVDMMIRHNYTCYDMEERTGISHSTIWWTIQHRLPYIDSELYTECMKLLAHHREEHKRRK